MIGLPQVVGPLGLVAVKEVERLGVGGVALVGEFREGGVYPADDAANLAVGGLGPAVRGGDLRGPALDGGHRGPRGHERQPLYRRHKSFGEFVAVATIAARLSAQAREPLPLVGRHPSLRRP